MNVPERSSAVPTVVPVQLVPLPDGVIVKRGRMEFKVGGQGAYGLVLEVLDAAARGVSLESIVESHAGPLQDSVRALVEQFERHRLVLPADEGTGTESPLDLFHWSAGPGADGATDRAAKARVTVIGVNEVSRALVSTLGAAGFRSVDVVHYPFLCNLRLLDDSGRLPEESWPAALAPPVDYGEWAAAAHPDIDCLVATSDFGGLDLMRIWNEYAMERRIPFLPVVLQDLVGYLGPFSVRDETACFECTRARQNANLDDPATARATEPLAFVGQGVTAAYHPAMPAVLGNLAAMEISRYVGGWGLPRSLGTLVEVDLLAPELHHRPVLKLPRCRVCGDTSRTSTTEIFSNLLLPGTHEPHR